MSAARHRAPVPGQPGAALIRGGAVVFGLGVVAIAAEFLPFLTGRRDLPFWLGLTTELLAPTGLGLALLGLLRSVRSRPPAPREHSGRS